MIITLLGRLIDPSGQPAPGVGIALTQVPPAHSAKERRILGTTVSDSNGGFSIPFEQPRSDIASYQVELSTTKKPFPLPDLGTLEDTIFGPHTLIVPPAALTNGRKVAPSRTLFASDEDLVRAWKQEPALFSRPAAAIPPNPCNPAMPRDVPARVFYLNQVHVFPHTGRPAGGAAGHGVTSAYGGAAAFGGVPASGVPPYELAARRAYGTGMNAFFDPPPLTETRFGAVFEFRQEWWDCGQTLGNLLYSVPLAPCEETKIAAVDWRRRDMATQRTSLDEEHQQDTTITRDQMVDEAVRMLSDKQVMSTTSGGGWGLSIGPFTTGHSDAASNMSEAVDASTNAARSVNDRTRQVSNTVRHTRSFAVAEVTQEEETTVRTRVIRNHNHCHTLTIQYYEVLQVFLLATRVSRIRPALLLPFAPLTFDLDAVRRYGYLLRRALLDGALEPILAELIAPETAPPSATQPESEATAPTSAAPAQGTVTGLRLHLNAVDQNGTAIPSPVNFLLQINDNDLSLIAESYDPLTERAILRTATIPPGLTGSDIQRVGIRIARYIINLTTARIDDLKIEMQLDNSGWVDLLYLESVELAVGRRSVHRVGNVAGVPAAAATGAELAPRLDLLLGHLNSNRVYYTGEILAAGDAGQRYLALAAIGVADYVENAVVGKVGNYLVFPVSRLEALPANIRAGLEDDAGLQGPGEVAERLITLPTPGVFAESQLGNCSACEKIDDTVFWNWQTSPCPDEAPAITSDMLASRYQSPSTLIQVAKSDLQPTPVQLPTLPEPMIKIGDATLAELVKGLTPQDTDGVLGLVGGLAKISSDHSLEVFKEIWHAYTGQAGGPGGGETPKDTSANDTAGAGDATPGLVDGGAIA